jgi:outer membrane autotransporter protein
MNRSFKTIWSERTQCFVAVSETTRGRGKRGAIVRTVGLALVAAASVAMAGPIPSATFDGIGTHDISGLDLENSIGNTEVAGTNGAQITGSDVTIVVNGPAAQGITPAGVKVTNGSSADLSDSTITTNGYNVAGVRAAIAPDDSLVSPTQDATVSATNVSITTSADHSHGAQALSVDGDPAKASVTLVGGSVTTHGNDSFGLHSHGDQATITTSANVTTTGGAGFGAFAEDGGTIIFNGGTVHTEGGRSPTSQQPSLGLLAVGGSHISGTVNVTTDGDGSHAVDAESLAQISLTNATIQTNGIGSYGVNATSGASVVLNGGSVTTAYNAGAVGTDTGEIRSYALNADGAGTHITTTGTALHTIGQRSYGVYATNGGAVTLNGGAIQTEGFMSYGVYASGAGSTITTNNTNISTTGQVGDGAWAYNGGVVNLNGGTISISGGPYSVEGETANGLTALGGGQAISGGVTAGGVINARGITLQTNGINSSGILAGASIGDTATFGIVNLTDSSVTVTGAGANAAEIDTGSTFNATNSKLISTQGVGIEMTEASTVTLNNTTVQAGLQSIHSSLSQAGQNQLITVGSGSVLTQNNGTLLQVDRSAQGGGAVRLNLQNGSISSGTIIDNLNGVTLDPDGGTYVTVGDQATFSGKVMGVKDFETAPGTSGQTLTFESGTQLGSLDISGDGTSTHGGTRAAPIMASGNIIAENSAVFGGNWQIAGSLTTTHGSVVAPGNSTGTITAAQINFGAGTIYRAEVNASGDADLINVTAGGADLSNTKLQVSQENGNGGLKLNYDYKILTATGAITPFEGAQYIGAPLISATPGYSPNLVTVRLGVNQSALAAMDLTHNQRAAAAGAASVAGSNANADAAFLSSNPAPAFDQLSGEVHASAQSALLASSDLLSNTVSQRLRGNLNAGMMAGAATSDAGQGSAASALPTSAASPLWAQVVGNWQSFDGKNGSANVDQDVYGLYLGGDAAVGAGWRLGGLFGYANSNIHLNDRSSRASVDSYTLGLYTGNSWDAGPGRINFTLGGGYTLHDIDTRRNVAIGGNQELRSSYDAQTAQVFTELGYELPVAHHASVEPYLGLAYLNQHSDSFNEDGGSAALHGSSSTEDTTSTTLGLRGKMALDYRGKQVTLRAGAGWKHAFGNLTPVSDLAFIQGGGTSFNVEGAPIASNAAVVELGAEVPLGSNSTVGLSYGGQFGEGNTDNSGSLYVKVRF